MTIDRQEEILKYILKPAGEREEMPKKLEQQYHRIIKLVSILSQHRLTKDAIDVYMEVQRIQGQPVSQSQAYRDLADAKHVAGEMEQVNKKFERTALANWQKEVMAKAVKLDDIRGFNSGMANLIKILGMDRNDPLPIDYRELQPVRPIFGFFPELFEHDDLPSDEDFLATIEELKRPAKYRPKIEIHAEDIDHTRVD